MEYANLIFYSLFFLFSLFLALYNFAYTQRVGSSSYRLGFLLPRILRRALKTNAIISFVTTAIITMLFLEALLALNLPAF